LSKAVLLIAALHLSSARIFKTVVDIKNCAAGETSDGLCEMGELLHGGKPGRIPGTFPTFAYGFYAVGLLLIIVTITGERR
jgi:hypothetical protein